MKTTDGFDEILKGARFDEFSDYQDAHKKLRELRAEIKALRDMMPRGFSLEAHLAQQAEIHPDVLSVFPEGQRVGDVENWSGGMELRDWFAGMIVSGLIAADKSMNSADKYASKAYKGADAMLAERAKK